MPKFFVRSAFALPLRPRLARGCSAIAALLAFFAVASIAQSPQPAPVKSGQAHADSAFHRLDMDRSQGRSMVMTRYGIVSADTELAAQAGATLLAHGGNAIDAAIAANAVVGLVEPMFNGIGGDLFVIYYDAKSHQIYGLNASGWAPRALTIAHLRAKGDTHMPGIGIDSVTVPGVVDGWAKLSARFGRKPLAADLAPAIRYAREGFPVPELVAAQWENDWAEMQATLAHSPNARQTFLTGGRAPKAGQIFRNPDLAHSLELIASQGESAFYRGEIAQQILALSQQHGGAMTAEDLADYSAEWVTPLHVLYHGWMVYELPPNGQGMAALEMLNILSHFPLAAYGHNTANDLQASIEAWKLAFADLRRYDGDPRFSHVPIAGLLSASYGAQQARRINLQEANCDVNPGVPPPAPGHGDTEYLTAVDKDGNMVSLIQSNSGNWGSGLVPAGTGFFLQNRGGLFTLDAHSPDALAGHKRPLHTIIPGFMQKGDRHISFGIMSGFNQPEAHAQFVSNVVDFGMNIQAALEAARFTKGNVRGCNVTIEDRVPAPVRQALIRRGQDLRVVGDFSQAVGGGHAVEHDDATGVNFGASGPRKDGEAVPEPLPGLYAPAS